MPQPLDGGYLWKCNGCYLTFRWPTSDQIELDALYVAGAEDAWTDSSAERRDWHIARHWLNDIIPEGSAVLDIGCFDGGFLGFLGDRYQRYGIEIHPGARQRAEAKGITLIGTNFQSPLRLSERMDCITAFDVIEHVPQPAHFLARCRDLVRPEGRIIIATGNADSPSFRFMRARYWYCTIAEHLSFISPRWCDKNADELRLIIETTATFSHGKRDWLHYPPEMTKNILYRFAPRFCRWLRRQGFGGKNVNQYSGLGMHPPVWMAANDHFVALFQKR